MNILIDRNVAYNQELFSPFGKVLHFSSRSIDPALLKSADALIIRSTTKIDEIILHNSAVKFIGTATAGVDHIDLSYLRKKNIIFSNAPGCNANAVAEYVLNVLLLLAQRHHFNLQDKVVGIVGVGAIGSRVHEKLSLLGVRTLLCDPPRAENEPLFEAVSLDHVIKKADILTLHTPLNKIGPHKTYHLINQTVLAAMPSKAILINSARGAIIDNNALLSTLQKGKKLRVVLDVFESEPDILWQLVPLLSIATPHIAGYSLEGKVRGTLQIAQALGHFLNQSIPTTLATLLPRVLIKQINLDINNLHTLALKRLMDIVYDVRNDDEKLRYGLYEAANFDQLRKHYPFRREWQSLLINTTEKNAILLRKLGFDTCSI